MTEIHLPPRAPRGEVSAQRTEGSWGVASVEASVHFTSMQRLEDGIQNAGSVPEHIVVPEAENAKAARSQESISPSVIVRLFDMLATVQLDDDKGLQAGEVADVRPNGVLAAKLAIGHLPSTQMLPKDAFGVCWRFSKVSSVTKHHELHHAKTP